MGGSDNFHIVALRLARLILYVLKKKNIQSTLWGLNYNCQYIFAILSSFLPYSYVSLGRLDKFESFHLQKLWGLQDWLLTEETKNCFCWYEALTWVDLYKDKSLEIPHLTRTNWLNLFKLHWQEFSSTVFTILHIY